MLIDLIDNESKRDIAMLESFDEDEIGSRMSMNFIEIKAGISIREAMRELINQAAENDNISTLYVTDDDHTFCGAIDLKDHCPGGQQAGRHHHGILSICVCP